MGEWHLFSLKPKSWIRSHKRRALIKEDLRAAELHILMTRVKRVRFGDGIEEKMVRKRRIRIMR